MKTAKRLITLLFAIMLICCMSAAVYAEETVPDGEETVTGRIIPYGIYEPEQTMLYESTKLKIQCERVHITDVITAEVSFSSTNYTELTMDGVKYTPYVADGKSTFMLPVKLGEPLVFNAHTTAMGGKDIDYKTTVGVELDKDNLKVAERSALQDGYYTTTVSTKTATWGWRNDKGTLQLGYQNPAVDYELPVTIKIEGGKIADIAYTKDPNEVMMNTESDLNYLLWAMDGHNVEAGYAYLSKSGGNYEKYHLNNPFPAKCGTGIKEQLVGKSDITGVDAVTSATVTSRAVIDSVDQSLTKAERGQKDDPEPVLPQPDTSEDIIPADGVYILESVDAVGTGVDCETAPPVLHVEDGKILADIGIEERTSTYPLLYPGTEVEALAAGEDACAKAADYDYGYKYTGSMYKNIPVKSLDKGLIYVIKSKSSGNWFNRLLTFHSEGMVRIPQAEDKDLYTEASYNAVADAYEAFISTRDNVESKQADIAAAKDALLDAVSKLASSYNAAEDDGERKNQNEVSNNIVYSSTGMFRIQDEGTSVTKNEDGSATVTIKIFPRASTNYDRIALTEYPEGTKKEAEAKLDTMAIKATKIEEMEGENGQTGEAATVYSPEFTFTISSEDIGKKIPLVYSAEGAWKNKAYYMIVLTEKEAAERQEAIKEAAEKETAEQGASSAIENAEKIDQSKYSADSYAKVEAALKALKEVMANPNATAEQIAAAKTALDNAMKGLKAKAAPAPVKKKANTMKVTPVKKTFKAKKLKKKAKTFKAVKVKKAKGKVTYIGKPSGKKAKKFLKFNKKTGKITVKKGAKKGKYVMKVTVKAAGNATYKSAVKTVKVVVTVK